MPQAEHDYLQLRTLGVLAVAVSPGTPGPEVRARDEARRELGIIGHRLSCHQWISLVGPTKHAS